MSDEYFWNREGEPDAEIVRLEKMLGRLRYNGFAPRQKRRYPSRWWLAAAAVFFAGIGVLLRPAPRTSWQLADGHGLRAGQLVETTAVKGVTIESASTGKLDIEPGSRVRLIASAETEQRFHLEHGTIHALIWAPPGRFIVDTPSAKTTDLGCSYTLQVSENGAGLLTVQTGWVAFESQQGSRKIESFIPAGAACITRPDRGPGSPWFSDAPEPFKHALADFDARNDPVALAAVLAGARDRDALTLWHLLVRTQGEQRGEVFDRFAQHVDLPASVTRDAVIRGESEAIDAAWNALNLGSTTWWREWKRKW